MKVLLISHTCASRAEGQPKAHCLTRHTDLELRLLMPDRWYHYGTWKPAEPPVDAAFQWEIQRIKWAWSGPGQWYLHWYPGLKKLIKSFQPDIIDLWEEPWGLVSAHACRLRNRYCPQARIISETEQNINKKLPFPFERFRSYSLRNADFVIGRNSESIEVVRSKGYRGEAEVVPNAVDAELFRPMDVAACRSEFGVSGFVVGYAGRLVEEKGIVDLLDSLEQCPPGVTALIVGTGPYEAPLKERAARLNGHADVRFLGALSPDRLARAMNAMDVLALPSRTLPRWKEQFGRVIIEANACGIPVIGSDSGAIKDVVGEAGLIVPEADPPSLARALSTLMLKPELAREMGKKGRIQVESRYTWQRVADQMHSIYTRVFHSRESAAVPSRVAVAG